MGKRVLVIGAGIAGLSAASYLQRNGFETEIFELHDLPGGLCTAWSRKGYRFDACIHWLMGSSPRSNLFQIWKELGAGELEYREWEVFTVVRLPGGESFTVYTDPDRLQAEMLRLGPGDGAFVRKLVGAIRRMSRVDLPAAFDKMRLAEVGSFLFHLPAALPLITTWMKRPLSELLGEIKGPRLREAFDLLFGEGLEGFPAAGLVMMLGFQAKRSSGYPLGGSLGFAQALEKKYLSLGGKIRYGFKVDEILVENGRAVGIRGEGGEARGDIVVSAADGHDSLERLLGGRYRSPALDAAFSSMKRYPSLIFVGIGFAADYKALPHSFSFALPEPLRLEGGALEVRRLGIRLFHFDPGSAPAGKTSGLLMIETSNDAYWSELREKDPAAYAAEKREFAEKVLAALDREVPGMRQAAEIVDVATPATIIRYTNNWHGSYEGWLPSIGSLGAKLPRTLPGLENFHMVGQWLNPGGGIPPCGIDGRRLAKRLCKAEGRKFRPD